MPGVKVYPHKEVETGTQICEPDLGVPGSSSLFGKDGVSGLVNVDLTQVVAGSPSRSALRCRAARRWSQPRGRRRLAGSWSGP